MFSRKRKTYTFIHVSIFRDFLSLYRLHVAQLTVLCSSSECFKNLVLLPMVLAYRVEGWNSLTDHVGFYRAMHFSAKRGIAIACRLSVRPSVCPSVCDVGEL